MNFVTAVNASKQCECNLRHVGAASAKKTKKQVGHHAMYGPARASASTRAVLTMSHLDIVHVPLLLAASFQAYV